jgi:hypothetical protein
MRCLPVPTIDDFALLDSVVNNRRLRAASVIRPLANRIADRYREYQRSRGNPWHVPQSAELIPARESFKAVYDSPPVALAFISDQRAGTRGACPMCGGGQCSTLDHYLPRADFPEYSFLSCNLVPACFNCNTARNAKYIGAAADARAIHPYYDQELSGRLITMEVIPPFEAPRFKVISSDGPTSIRDAVDWHISNVLVPAGIVRHFMQRWSRLLNKPALHLGNEPDAHAIGHRLREDRDKAADLNESANCWDSCFLDGLTRNHQVLLFLSEKLLDALAQRIVTDTFEEQ